MTNFISPDSNTFVRRFRLPVPAQVFHRPQSPANSARKKSPNPQSSCSLVIVSPQPYLTLRLTIYRRSPPVKGVPSDGAAAPRCRATVLPPIPHARFIFLAQVFEELGSVV